MGTDYTVTTTVFQAAGAIAFFPEGMFSYPMQPTHVVQINVQTRPNDSLIVYREVAPAGASWFWVVPCPNAQGVQWMREQRLAGEKQHARASQLAAEIKEPLLSQIKELLKQHNRVAAIKKYQAATGADVTTSVLVIDAMDSKSSRDGRLALSHSRE